jgi:Flp pilus assembly pilin Flp
MRFVITLARDTRGATGAEYALALALVTVVGAGAWTSLGNSVEVKVDCAARAITGSASSGPCVAGAVVVPSPDGTSPAAVQEPIGNPSSFEDELHQALEVARRDFEALAGDDGRITRESLEAALTNDDPAVRETAQFLLDHPAAFSALDVGAGRGDVDGEISQDDFAGFQERASEESTFEILADTGAGRGDQDGKISKDDLEAIASDETLPIEIRQEAATRLERGDYD